MDMEVAKAEFEKRKENVNSGRSVVDVKRDELSLMSKRQNRLQPV